MSTPSTWSKSMPSLTPNGRTKNARMGNRFRLRRQERSKVVNRDLIGDGSSNAFQILHVIDRIELADGGGVEIGTTQSAQPVARKLRIVARVQESAAEVGGERYALPGVIPWNQIADLPIEYRTGDATADRAAA